MASTRKPAEAPDAGSPLARLVAAQRASTAGAKLSTDDIVHVLRQAIVRGIFHPGQALPQDELAAEFQVSKIPVREALRTLQAQGFVALPHNRGALVQPLTLAQLQDAFELRLLVEPSLMRTAAPRLTRAMLDEADRLIRAMDRAKTAWEFSECNVRFHDLLYGAAERPLSQQILAMLQGHIQRMSFMQLSLAGFDRSSNEDHRVIMAALRKGDAEAAARAVAAHVKGVRKIVLALHARHGEGI